jgi:ATP-binding cassette, subfamily B, bacterial CvaB/MchF/RaxB
MEAADCGLACVAMVADHFGIHKDYHTLRMELGTSVRGSTLQTIVHQSEKLSIATRAIRVELEDLRDISCPAILHWDMKHFVVLHRAKKNKLKIFDPAEGIRWVPLEEASRRFTGIVLEMWPSPDFQPTDERKVFSLSDFLTHFRGLWASLSSIGLLGLLIEILGLAAPMISKWLIDDALPAKDFALYWLLVLGALTVLVARQIATLGRNLSVVSIAAQINSQWGARLKKKLLSLPISFFEARTLGDISSKFAGFHQITRTLTGNSVEVLLDGVFAFLPLLVLLYLDWALGCLSMAFVALYIAVRWLTAPGLMRLQEQALQASAAQNNQFIENVRGILTIRANGIEGLRLEEWRNLYLAEVNDTLQVQRRIALITQCVATLSNLRDWAVAAMGIWLVLNGGLTLGAYIAVLAYSVNFGVRGNALIDKIVEIRLLGVQAHRLSDLTETSSDPTVGEFSSSVTDDAVLHDSAPLNIELQQVSFSYSPNLPLTIENLNLTIRAGESVAIIGRSGAGKTTLLKIILGLYEPTQGQILIDGRIAGAEDFKRLRLSSGIVVQGESLFGGTIAQNISMFSPSVSMEEIIRCAKASAIHDDIERMPMGYRTPVGDMGSALSGGQVQRIIIARALCRRPALLLMDEATSHLDHATELLVNGSLKDMKVSRVIIAHRKETIEMCDRIFDITDRS